MSLVLYHNPRCSKSRAALQLLEERGLSPRIVLYLETPPTAAELKVLIKRLGLRPHDLLRTSDPAYRELGLEGEMLSDEKLVAAMVARPSLIERPILMAGKRAVIGRPPERVLDIL
jgi:arsenate reductase